METITVKKNLVIDVELAEFTDKFGVKHSVSEKLINELISNLKKEIIEENVNNKKICLSNDKEYDFDAFEVDKEALKNYNEEDTEKYKHFVWEFCRKYYLETELIRHNNYTSRDFAFKVKTYQKNSDLHLDLINLKEKNKEYDEALENALKEAKKIYIKNRKEDYSREAIEKLYKIWSEVPRKEEKSIKDFILLFLEMSFEIDTNQNDENCYYGSRFEKKGYKNRLNVNKENFKYFVDFILDSKMCSINEEILFDFEKVLDLKWGYTLTVGAALVNICIHLDYEEGLDYLIEKGLKHDTFDAIPNKTSWFYCFLELIKSKSFLGFCCKLDKRQCDSEIAKEALKKLENKLKWIGIITERFPQLKISKLESKNKSKINKKGNEIFYTIHSERTYFLTEISSKNLNNYLNFDKDEFKIILKYINPEFLKNNIIKDNKDVAFVKKVFNHFKSLNLKDTLVENYFENHKDLSVKIEAIQSGGYIQNNNGRKSISKSYNRDLITRYVEFNNNLDFSNVDYYKEKYDINLDPKKSYVFLYDKNTENSTNCTYTYVNKLKHHIELDKFYEDIDALNYIIESWLSGERLSETDIKMSFKAHKNKIMEEISRKEKEICELKKKIGENCD